MVKNLNISKFTATTTYNWKQICIISRGLELGLDVSKYTNPLFTPEQMWQIFKGLEENIDVSEYANISHTDKHMQQIRWNILKNLKE